MVYTKINKKQNEIIDSHLNKREKQIKGMEKKDARLCILSMYKIKNISL